MKLQNTMLALTFAGLASGCTVQIVGSDTDDTNVVTYEEVRDGMLYLDECAVVSSTNMLRAVTYKTDGTSYDDGANIKSGTVRSDLYTTFNENIQQYYGDFTNWNYGDTIITSITFPAFTTLTEMVGAWFDYRIEDITVDYWNATSLYTGDIDNMKGRDCFYVYNLTYYNDSYTGSRAARAADGMSFGKMTVRDQQSNESKVADVAMNKFDMLADFAQSYGIEAGSRAELVQKIQDEGLMGALLEYRTNLKKAMNDVAGDAVARTRAALSNNIPEGLKAKMQQMKAFADSVK